MTFALIKNGEVVAYQYSLTTFRSENPDVSLPEDPTEAQLNEQGIYTVYPTNQPSYNAITQNCTEGTPTLQNGKWTQVWVVSDATQEEINIRKNEIKEKNKSFAMQLLKDTDWTATMDVSDPQYSNPCLANQTEFLQYRSEVRKIAINPPSEEVVFPSIPEEVWSA